MVPGVHYYMPAGSCRGIYSRPYGRHEPLHHSCKMSYNYAQGHSVSPLHPGRASTLLKSFPEICFRISVGCKLCRVFDQYRGWEVRVGYTAGIVWDSVYVNSVLFYLFCFSAQPRQAGARFFFSFTFSAQPR